MIPLRFEVWAEVLEDLGTLAEPWLLIPRVQDERYDLVAPNLHF